MPQTIVIDVGCKERRLEDYVEESVYTLADRFLPDLLIGIDPDLELEPAGEYYRETVIARIRAVAWINNEPQPVEFNGIRTGVDYRPGRDVVMTPAVDLLRMLALLPGDARIILKLDCEGAEFTLLPAIRDAGLDAKLARILVEWHPTHGTPAQVPAAHHGLSWTSGAIDAFVQTLRCPVESWPEP